MANSNHMALLERGVEAWNQWRQLSPHALPDLENADLRPFGPTLSKINFSKARLCRAKLTGVSLACASLYDADLSGAVLVDVDLSGADLRGANFAGAIVDGVEHDRNMRCLGVRVETCSGSARFKRAALEADYIEAFAFEHPFLARAWSVTSDCSRSPLRIGLIGLFLAAVFGLVYVAFPSIVSWADPSQPQRVRSWFSPLYYSITTFTTLGYGDFHPANIYGEILAACEALLGYVWLGYLVSVLAARTSNRA